MAQVATVPGQAVVGRGRRRSSEYEGVVVVLARLVPTHLHGRDSRIPELLKSVRQAFHTGGRRGKPSLLTYGCMGRQDVLVLVRTPKLESAGRIWRPRGLRKIDLQCGYMPRAAADALFDQNERAPLLLAVYAKFDDAIVAREPTPPDLWGEAGLIRVRPREGVQQHVIRTLGWNDAVILREHWCLSKLIDGAPEVWGESAGTPAARRRRPLYDRTHSLVGYELGPNGDDASHAWLDRIRDGDDDLLNNPRVEMRIRPGRSPAVRKLVVDELEVAGVQPTFATELGHEDGTVTYPRESGLPVKLFLEAYYRGFLPQACHLVHSTQLCLSSPEPLSDVDVEAEVARARRQVRSRTGFGYISLESVAEDLRAALSQPITASAADCLHAFYEACDWSIENETLRTTFGDLHWHLGWLVDHLVEESVAGWPPELRKVMEELPPELHLLGTAFAQRLGGAYYGIMGYHPEHLLSHTMSLHKVVVGLWALHTLILTTIRRDADGRPIPFRPRGCWVVSHGQSPLVGTDERSSARALTIAQLPSRGVVALETIAAYAAHEIGHIIYNTQFDRYVYPWAYPNATYPQAESEWAAEVFYQAVALFGGQPAEGGPPEPPWADEQREQTWEFMHHLAMEVFADTFAMAHLCGGPPEPDAPSAGSYEEAFLTYAFRLLRYLPLHRENDAVPLVLRTFALWYELVDANQPGAEHDGLVPSGAMPMPGEDRCRWLDRVTSVTFPPPPDEAWQRFGRLMAALAPPPDPSVVMPFDLALALRCARAEWERLAAAGPWVPALVADLVTTAVALSDRAAEPGDEWAERHAAAREAFVALARAADSPGADLLKTRFGCYERLWHEATRLLSERGDYPPTHAGTCPASSPPWRSVFSRTPPAT